MQDRLENAPIVEAIIDIQHRFKKPVSTDRLEFSIEGYDQAEPFSRVEIQEKEGQVAKMGVAPGIFGYRYFSPSLGVAAQYRTNGVTVSKLKPYDSWESFQPIAREHWQKYCLQVDTSAETVSRIAVRYINRLMVPVAGNEGIVIQHYLKNAPETPDEVNRPWLDEFLCRMVMPLPEFGGKVVIHSIMEAMEEQYLPLVLDLDVFKQLDTPQEMTADQIWDVFEQMRNVKNELFSKMMTKKALELCR